MEDWHCRYVPKKRLSITVAREREIKTTESNCMPSRMLGKTVIASKDAKQCKLSLAPGVNAKQCSHFGKQFGSLFERLNGTLPYDPEIVLLGIYPTDLKTHLHTDSCARLLIASVSHNHQKRSKKEPLPWADGETSRRGCTV